MNLTSLETHHSTSINRLHHFPSIQALCATAKQIWDTGIRKVKLKIEEAVDLGNDLAYTRGLVTFLLEDDTVAMPGK